MPMTKAAQAVELLEHASQDAWDLAEALGVDYRSVTRIISEARTKCPKGKTIEAFCERWAGGLSRTVYRIVTDWPTAKAKQGSLWEAVG